MNLSKRLAIEYLDVWRGSWADACNNIGRPITVDVSDRDPHSARKAAVRKERSRLRERQAAKNFDLRDGA